MLETTLPCWIWILYVAESFIFSHFQRSGRSCIQVYARYSSGLKSVDTHLPIYLKKNRIIRNTLPSIAISFNLLRFCRYSSLHTQLNYSSLHESSNKFYCCDYFGPAYMQAPDPYLYIGWNSIRLSGPAHGIMTKTEHKTLPRGGRMGVRGVVVVGRGLFG